ncbi:MAG: sugar ABC transporter permease [Bauldia sp.]|nr:sugar ABC transporter permease [Bauldia sp.]
MAFCGVLPIAFVFFYSVHDVFAGNSFIFVGVTWFEQLLTSREFWGALARSLGFSALVLAIEIPLGIYIALRLPARGLVSSVLVVLLAIPLLAPLIVVGYLWKVLTLTETGLLTAAAALVGIDLDMNDPVVVWIILLLMDAWHWTSLVVLLCFAGLRAIPDAYYQAARIDGASGWAVFRHIQLPKLRLVLLIAILLRLMDSFVIYTEAYIVTRGGPGVSTTFLSHELVQTATIQFDLGEGGAMSVIYFLIVLAVSWAFFRLIVPARSRAERSALA